MTSKRFSLSYLFLWTALINLFCALGLMQNQIWNLKSENSGLEVTNSMENNRNSELATEVQKYRDETLFLMQVYQASQETRSMDAIKDFDKPKSIKLATYVESKDRVLEILVYSSSNIQSTGYVRPESNWLSTVVIVDQETGEMIDGVFTGGMIYVSENTTGKIILCRRNGAYANYQVTEHGLKEISRSPKKNPCQQR